MLLAAFGASTLVGALASPLFRRALSMRAILLLELWTGLGIVAFVVWPNVYVLTAAFVVQGITLPVTDSVVEGYRIASLRIACSAASRPRGARSRCSRPHSARCAPASC